MTAASSASSVLKWNAKVLINGRMIQNSGLSRLSVGQDVRICTGQKEKLSEDWGGGEAD